MPPIDHFLNFDQGKESSSIRFCTFLTKWLTDRLAVHRPIECWFVHWGMYFSVGSITTIYRGVYLTVVISFHHNPTMLLTSVTKIINWQKSPSYRHRYEQTPHSCLRLRWYSVYTPLSQSLRVFILNHWDRQRWCDHSGELPLNWDHVSSNVLKMSYLSNRFNSF